MKTTRLSARLLMILGILSAFVLALAACSAPENSNTAVTTGNGNTTTTSTTTTTTAPAATATTTAAAPSNTNTAATNMKAAPAGEKIGVEECDDYLAKYEACLDSKVPAAARATMKSSFEQTRESWRKLAATPQGKAGLAQACKAAHDAAKQSMAAYGCTF